MKQLFFLLSVLFFNVDAMATTITFESKAHLPQNKELYLQDIAVLSIDDTDILEALKSIKVASSAQEAERMTAQEIIRKIRPQLKVIEKHCECKLQIHIPKEMSEYSINGVFTTEKLLSKVQMSLQDVCVDCELEIKDSSILRGAIPEKYLRWSAEVHPRELKGTSMVRVYFDDNALNPVVYQMYVGIQKPVLKLRHSLPAGAQPSAKDFDVLHLDVTHEVRSLAKLADLTNTEIKRSLGAGEFLTTNDLVLKFSVRLGETVKVISKNKNLEMEMTGIAQKNGRTGDKIPVRLASTRKDIFAEILADGRVGL